MNRSITRRCSLLLPVLISYAPHSIALDLHHSPLYLTNSKPPNLLLILDNSNSMDESPTGIAVGSDSSQSKSEIARSVIKGMIDRYMGKINIGLMAYQQSDISTSTIHNAIYDLSFDPNNYDPDDRGLRSAAVKRFRSPNPSLPGNYLYYNIALPFYSQNNQGNAFCYSATAVFDSGNESPITGPWDRYQCYRQKTDTQNDHPTGFSQYIGRYTFSPTDSDYAQNILDFGKFMAWSYIGPAWYSNNSPGKGYLHTPIAPLNQQQADLLHQKLATSQFQTNQPTAPDLPLQNAGLTPLEGTLSSAADYFKGILSDPQQGGPQSAPPDACDNNYIAMLSDGLPSTSADGSTISDPRQALAGVSSAAANLHQQGVNTYLIGFSLPVGTDPQSLNNVASAGGTGQAYSATDPDTLQQTFDTIFEDIFSQLGSSSATAVNSSSVDNNSWIYQAHFNSENWQGDLQAISLSSSGLASSPIWQAAVQLNLRNTNRRTILTYGRDSHKGIPFRWNSLNAETNHEQIQHLQHNSQGIADNLARERIAYLRGQHINGMRRRQQILGDIINSSPLHLGPPDAGYTDTEMPGYSTFASTHKNRKPTIYVGANDGMLHGFDAGTGEELLAYVPAPIYPNLSKLTDPDYGSAGRPHHYFVDGSPLSADVQWQQQWRTVLVSGLNAGGQGYFALDVTQPEHFSEQRAEQILLWEFSDRDDPDLGYSVQQPSLSRRRGQSRQIVKMNNNRWAVILGNGYNNTEADGYSSQTGHAYLFILFIEAGADGGWQPGDYIKIDTGSGQLTQPNGLATPTPLDSNLDGKTDVIYAGDLNGNLFKFDVSSQDPTQWGSAYHTDQGQPLPLFRATAPVNNIETAQPITAAPVITRHPQGGYLIGFGTGQYLQQTDIHQTQTQSFYAIWDNNTPIRSRAELQQQSISGQLNHQNEQYRISTSNPVRYHCQQQSCTKGWYLDLPSLGERIVYNPQIYQRKFIFSTLIPDTAACASGGTGWAMALNYLTGTAPPALFDTNHDRVINQADELDTGNSPDVSDTQPASGVKSQSGILTGPTIVEDREFDHLIFGASGASNNAHNEHRIIATEKPLTGRLSWQEKYR